MSERGLGLTENQEDALRDILMRFVKKSSEIFSEGKAIHSEFEKIVDCVGANKKMPPKN